MKKFLTTGGPFLIVIAALLWAFDGLIRQKLYALAPSVIVFYEHLIGALIIAPFALPLLKKEKVDAKTWKALFVVALFSGVIGTLFFTAALVKVYFISLSVVFLLQKLQPLFAIAFGVVVMKEKVTYHYFYWAALAFLAAYFITFPSGSVNLATGAGTVTAALLALGAAFAWGSSTAFSRYSVTHISSTLSLGLRFFITVPLALLTVVILGDFGGLSSIQPVDIGRLVFISLTTGMVALWIYYKGLQNTEVKVATILEYAFPMTALILDFFINHTVLAPMQYTAIVVLFFAMYRVSLLNRSKPA